MPLNEISAFHPLVIIGMGIAFAVIWFVTKHGFAQGGNSISGAESKSAAQVVAIAADTKALDRVKDSGEKLSDTIISFERVYEKRSDEMNRRMEDLTDAIKQTNFEIRELGKEIRNSSH